MRDAISSSITSSHSALFPPVKPPHNTWAHNYPQLLTYHDRLQVNHVFGLDPCEKSW